jgi:hypothetical protein
VTHSAPPTEGVTTPPSICPVCRLTADNAVTVSSELTTTATYCDTAGHMWAVTWLEVA